MPSVLVMCKFNWGNMLRLAEGFSFVSTLAVLPRAAIGRSVIVAGSCSRPAKSFQRLSQTPVEAATWGEALQRTLAGAM